MEEEEIASAVLPLMEQEKTVLEGSGAAALAAVVAAGGRAIDGVPRPGSRGTTVAFVHPKGSFGTLIELVQEPASG